MLLFILPVHDYPMWNVNTLYVFMVVFRVSEQVQAISWPVIFYLGQTAYCYEWKCSTVECSSYSVRLHLRGNSYM